MRGTFHSGVALALERRRQLAGVDASLQQQLERLGGVVLQRTVDAGASDALGPDAGVEELVDEEQVAARERPEHPRLALRRVGVHFPLIHQ